MAESSRNAAKECQAAVIPMGTATALNAKVMGATACGVKADSVRNADYQLAGADPVTTSQCLAMPDKQFSGEADRVVHTLSVSGTAHKRMFLQ